MKGRFTAAACRRRSGGAEMFLPFCCDTFQSFQFHVGTRREQGGAARSALVCTAQPWCSVRSDKEKQKTFTLCKGQSSLWFKHFLREVLPDCPDCSVRFLHPGECRNNTISSLGCNCWNWYFYCKYLGSLVCFSDTSGASIICDNGSVWIYNFSFIAERKCTQVLFKTL